MRKNSLKGHRMAQTIEANKLKRHNQILQRVQSSEEIFNTLDTHFENKIAHIKTSLQGVFGEYRSDQFAKAWERVESYTDELKRKHMQLNLLDVNYELSKEGTTIGIYGIPWFDRAGKIFSCYFDSNKSFQEHSPLPDLLKEKDRRFNDTHCEYHAMSAPHPQPWYHTFEQYYSGLQYLSYEEKARYFAKKREVKNLIKRCYEDGLLLGHLMDIPEGVYMLMADEKGRMDIDKEYGREQGFEIWDGQPRFVSVHPAISAGIRGFHDKR